MEPDSLRLVAIKGLPAIRKDDDLALILGDAIKADGLEPEPDDILVITHKIVSKAEGRLLDLNDIEASEAALSLAEETGKSPAFCEAVLSESRRIVRKRPGLIIAEHRLGMVMANAGIDQSNVSVKDGSHHVLLLPKDPDASAKALKAALSARFGVALAVIISDSVGRAWRKGVVGLALGAAGLPSLLDLRGKRDLDGRELQVTEVGLADQIASAAELLMGEADEGRPIVLVRGLRLEGKASPASALIRDPSSDLFR